MVNVLQDLILIYLAFALVSPIFIIGCINVILGQITTEGKRSLTTVAAKIDLNAKSYFCVLVLIVIGSVL